MKNSTKIILIVTALLLVAGLGLAIAGVSLGAKISDTQIAENTQILEKVQERVQDFASDIAINLDTDRENFFDENQEAWDADQIRNLSLDLKADELVMEAWDKDQIQVSFSDGNSGNPKISLDGDTLKIKGSTKLHDSSIRIRCPEEKQFQTVTIQVGAGEVTLNGAFATESLDVSLGAGSFTADGKLSADTANFNVGAGEIAVDRLAANEILGKCGAGELSLVVQGAKTDYNYTLKCGLGEISIDDESHTSFGGKDEITNDGAKYSMNLDCGLGEISVSFEK